MSKGKAVGPTSNKHSKDTYCSPGQVLISNHGMFNGITGTPPGLTEYGPTDGPGTHDYGLHRPGGAGKNASLKDFVKGRK